MSIDEAIKELTESYNFWMEFACDDVLEEGEHKVNHCEKNANYCYQLIQWLEELKDYRDNTKQIYKDLKYWLDNEEKGVVYIPKFIVERWIKLTMNLL